MMQTPMHKLECFCAASSPGSVHPSFVVSWTAVLPHYFGFLVCVNGCSPQDFCFKVDVKAESQSQRSNLRCTSSCFGVTQQHYRGQHVSSFNDGNFIGHRKWMSMLAHVIVDFGSCLKNSRLAACYCALIRLQQTSSS